MDLQMIMPTGVVSAICSLTASVIGSNELGIDWTAVFQDGIGTMSGAFLGFLFAFILARLQINWERRRDDENEKRLQSVLLKSAIAGCGLNIENGISFKSQFLMDLAPEIDAIEKVVLGGDPMQIVGVSETLKLFFQGHTPLARAELPSASDFRFAFDDVPMLVTFVHRADSASRALNEAIEIRNRMLADYAKANSRGVQVHELSYFMQMLISHARNIISHADDSIFFNELTHDQIYLYGKAKYGQGKFAKFELREPKRTLLADHANYAGYRDHIKDFTHTESPPWWKRLRKARKE